MALAGRVRGEDVDVPLGTGVTSTGARYHPAMIAQAWMTLERLFPAGRSSGSAPARR